MTTRSKWGLAAGGAVIAAAIVYSVLSPATVTYWHQGSVPVPCSIVKAYDPWVSPDDGKNYVLRYDYTAMSQSGGTLPRTANYGAGNHTLQSFLLDGYIHPLEPQPDVNNYYPAPTAEMGCVVDIHGQTWNTYNTSPCPIVSLAAYQSAIGNNSVWISGRNFYAAARQAECSAPPPTAPPTPPIVPTPTQPTGGTLCWTVTPQMICVTKTPVP